MTALFRSARPAVLAAALLAAPAAASDDGIEVWLNPSAAFAVDEDTGVEVETAQRLRRAADGRADTFYVRLWVEQDVAANIALSGGIERRVNDPGRDETRLMQQVSTRHGIVRTRFRLEQRFVDGARMGLRVRPRLGVDMPLREDRRWSFLANAELFLTLRSPSAGGEGGLTGLRTQIGVRHALSERVTVTLAYLRQQDIESGAPDRVGHAPLIGLDLTL